MFSKFFIHRPVFASVLSIVIVLFGLISMATLPVAQYPDILPPEVYVSAVYPGATSEIVAATVASPLEQSINGVDKMLYMTSTSSDSGSMSISVVFAVGSDPDQNTINVNNRVQMVLSQLPQEVRNQGVTVNKRMSSMLGVVSVYSPGGTYDTTFLSNYALLNIVDELKRTDGVGDVNVFGRMNYAIRVWLKPDKLAEYGLTTSDVASAIRAQNSQFAAGTIAAEPGDGSNAFTYSVTTKGRLVTPREFGEIILRADDRGNVLHLSDVARIELGAEGYSISGTMDGLPSANMGINMQPGANAVATAKAVRATMDRLAKSFPQGVEYRMPFDTTKFVSVAIEEVIKTFIEALMLVIFVVYLFLQNVRATIIPIVAVPVSIIGTFAGMAVLGFTINMMTLFGLILAIGIVVDDAIVVLENTERLMREKGLNSTDAAIESMREVTSPVVAIVLVLCAVFVPVAFIQGLSGELYQQFAITIAISVVISGFVALTLTPALCAIVLRHIDLNHVPAKPFMAFNRVFDKIRDAYLHAAGAFYKHTWAGLLVFAGVIAASAVMWMNLPSALVPAEDQGYVLAIEMNMPGTSLSRTAGITESFANMAYHHPAVSDVISIAGIDMTAGFAGRSSSGVAFIPLKDWSERTKPELQAETVAGQLSGMGFMQFRDSFFVVVNAPPISGLSMTGGFDGFIQNRGNASPAEIDANMKKFIAEASKRPELAQMRSSFSAATPRYEIVVDRERARAMGVEISDIFSTLSSTFGQSYINDFTLYGRNYKVEVQADSAYRNSPEDLGAIFVRNNIGQLVPIASLVSFHRNVGPDIMQRFNLFTAAPFQGQPAPGYSTGQALKAVEEVAATTLPRDYQVGWTGSAYQEKAVGNTAAVVFAFGIVMVFLILAAQYERWSLPFAVLTAIPFGTFGALIFVLLRGMQNNIYFQISLLVLIGLAAKNAILIVEFAVQLRDKGLTRREAALQALRLRFRPIVMTSMAFVLGCLPLAFSSGAGAASREAIGTGVVGGMLAATYIAVIFVPMFYRLIDRLGYKNPDALPVVKKEESSHA